MESFNEAWDLICDFCKTRITDVAYKTWISRIEPVKLDFNAGDAILMVPNEFHRQTLNRCYLSLLNIKIRCVFQRVFHISVILNTVALHPETVDCRSFSAVQYPGLYKGRVRRLSHFAA